MTDETRLSPEAAAFLARSGRAFWLTLRRDGSPTAHPMTAVVADDKLVFNTYRKSVKARNAARDPRTCCLLLTGYEEPLAEALVYKGRAGEVDPAALGRMRSPGARRPGAMSSSVPERAGARLEQGKRVLLAVEAEEVELLGGSGA